MVKKSHVILVEQYKENIFNLYNELNNIGLYENHSTWIFVPLGVARGGGGGPRALSIQSIANVTFGSFHG